MYIFKYWICFESIEKQEVYKKKKKKCEYGSEKTRAKEENFSKQSCHSSLPLSLHNPLLPRCCSPLGMVFCLKITSKPYILMRSIDRFLCNLIQYIT